MKIILALCLFLVLGVNSQAQNQKVLDSLGRVYYTAKHDTTRILALNSIASEYISNKPDTSVILAEKALKMSEKIGFEKGKSKAYSWIGDFHSTKGNYPQALTYYQKSLTINEQLGSKSGMKSDLMGVRV